MDGTARILTDPLKNVVHLPPCLSQEFSSHKCLDKELATVIEKPALIITLPPPLPLLYHFRSVDWNVTVLLQSERRQGAWVVSACTWNPDPTQISHLLVNGAFVHFDASGKEI